MIDVMDFNVDDARPLGSESFACFEVGWGAWRNPGSGSDAQIQSDLVMAPGVINIPADVFFASINPTPVALLPNDSASYGGPAAFFGGANGSFSQPVGSGGSTGLEALSVSFDLDFATGLIENGLLNVQYDSRFESVMAWEAGFSEFLNGAITDLNLDSLTLFEGGSLLGSGNLDASRITGVLTGPGGERHAGALSLLAENINSDGCGWWMWSASSLSDLRRSYCAGGESVRIRPLFLHRAPPCTSRPTQSDQAAR